MHDVHKRFGGVVALHGAALTASGGEVHALLGANGSGKSTLNKILTGVVAPDRAAIRLDGEDLHVARPQDAHAHGIAAVYQELSLIPDLSVAANVSLAIEDTTAGFLRPGAIRARAAAALAPFRDGFRHHRVPLDAPVRALAPGEQQLVEIAKALARRPRVLVLDEATASLYRAQVDVLFEEVRRLRDDGALVIFTSHRLAEIAAICDRATVLRNGETAGTVAIADATSDDLVELMIGARAPEPGDLRHTPAEVATRRRAVLEVAGLTTERLHDVSFSLHEGEVLGLGGLAGQGQSDVLAALFGAEKHLDGRIRIDGDAARLASPHAAVRSGIALVPGNRGRDGLLPVRSILENLTVPSMQRRAVPPVGALSRGRERAAADRMVADLNIKIGSLDDPVSTLSGGNQQKVVVGKWLLVEPRVVLLDDPTKGIDVGAKQELYALVARLTDAGVCVLFNSSDDEELLALSHRVLVLFEGRIVAELTGDALTQDRYVTASLHVEVEEPA